MALVAPLAGARIEIVMKYLTEKDRYVAPLAGARIEIVNLQHASCERKSLPSRERGLKSLYIQKLTRSTCRSPRGSAD